MTQLIPASHSNPVPPSGPYTPIKQGVVYALPARSGSVFSANNDPLEVSVDGITWTALGSGATVGSVFVRCPTKDTSIFVNVNKL